MKVGKWLGVSHQIGSPMTYWVLKDNGQVISRSSVIPLKNEQKEQYKDEMKKLQDTVNEKYDEYDPDAINVYDNDDIEDPFTDVDKPETDEEDGGPTGNTGKNDTVEGPSLFENAEIYLPHRDRNEIAKVIGRKRNADGNFVGRAHRNPILDSRVFTVQFLDGDQKDIAYNTIAEHLFSQVDEEGNQHRLFKEIIGHRRKKGALDKADQYRIGKDR